MKVKQSLLVGATLATVTLGTIGGAGLVSAATADSSNEGNSIAQKIADKFNLNKDEVQAVLDEAHKERHTAMKTNQQERLTQAVSEGKLTQEQADYITKAQDEIASLIGDAKPGEQSDAVREQIREKMDVLRNWAKDNTIDKRYLGHGGHVRIDGARFGKGHDNSTDS